jgi:hypothetical protein
MLKIMAARGASVPMVHGRESAKALIRTKAGRDQGEPSERYDRSRQWICRD